MLEKNDHLFDLLVTRLKDRVSPRDKKLKIKKVKDKTDKSRVPTQ